MVAFLGSDDASFVNGVNVDINGGNILHLHSLSVKT
jgi:hypothetical protein